MYLFFFKTENKITDIIIPPKDCIRFPGMLTKNTEIPSFRINASKRKYPKIIINSAITAATTVNKKEDFFLTIAPAI